MDKHKHSSKGRRQKNKARKSRPSGSGPAARTGDKRASGIPRKDDGGAFWIYGVHAVLAAIVNPARDCRRVVLAENAGPDLESRTAEALKSVPRRPAPERIDRHGMDPLLPAGSVHQGLAVLVRPLPEPALEDVIGRCDGRDDAVVVVLDQATDPRNIGAVMRSAAAFGAVAVIVQARHAPGVTGALCKAASGAVERLPYVRTVNLARAVGMLKQAGFWAAGLDPAAKRTLAEADLSGKVALVLGAEGAGLRRLTRDTCDELLRVPLARDADSLNLSNAAAVALYELARRLT